MTTSMGLRRRGGAAAVPVAAWTGAALAYAVIQAVGFAGSVTADEQSYTAGSGLGYLWLLLVPVMAMVVACLYRRAALLTWAIAAVLTTCVGVALHVAWAAYVTS